MPCSELDRLTQDYQAAAAAYTDFVQVVERFEGADLERARQYSRMLRDSADRAAQTLMHHREQHGC
jgi:hypothetical protein